MQAGDRERLLSRAIEIFGELSAIDKQADGPLCAIEKAASELNTGLPDDVIDQRTARKSELVRELEYRIMAVRIPAIVGSDSADRGHPRKAYILVTAILCSGGHDGSSFGVS
jgi:hypothetical protein